MQQAAVEWTAEDTTLIFIEIDNFPTLGPADRVLIRLPPLLSQPTPAPRALFEQRLQAKWRHRAKSNPERGECLLVIETRNYSPPLLRTEGDCCEFSRNVSP